MIRQAVIFAVLCSNALASSVTARNSATPEQVVSPDNSYYYQQQYPAPYYGYNWNNNNLNQKQDFGAGDELGTTGVTLGTVAIVAVVIVVILLAIPTILAIAALIYTAVTNGDWMPTMGMDKGNGSRSMTALKSLIDSENCIERISCAIGHRTMRRKNTYGSSSMNKADNGEFEGKGKPSLVQRISRAFKSDSDCASYKCSLFSYFS